MLEKKEKLYEGKAKILYKTNKNGVLIQTFKDDATAFDGKKKGTIIDKGKYNTQISAGLFKLLEKNGITTHYIDLVDSREMIVKKVIIIPLEVVVRNVAAGSLAKRLGWEEGKKLAKPVLEFYYKSDELGDPLLNESHIQILKIVDEKRLNKMRAMALKINSVLRKFLLKRNLDLIDFKLEFGLHNGKIILADEISPDTCRFWDTKTKERLDKDRFRRDLGNIEEAYMEVYKRICGTK